MVDHTAEVTVELNYEDGFREGLLHGYMAAIATPSLNDCDRKDCGRRGEP